MTPILCLLGLHSISSKTRFVPSIEARIVTEFHHRSWCSRCGLVVGEVHEQWNGKEFETIAPDKPAER